jgi:hypothetical protein
LDQVGRSIPIASAAIASTAASTPTAAAEAASATTTSAASTTTTATVAAATTTATAATSTAFFAGTGFVDGQRPTAMFLAVEGVDCVLGFFIGRHLDESESLAAAGIAIIDDLRRNHLAVLAKQLLQLGAINLVAQVANI